MSKERFVSKKTSFQVGEGRKNIFIDDEERRSGAACLFLRLTHHFMFNLRIRDAAPTDTNSRHVTLKLVAAVV